MRILTYLENLTGTMTTKQRYAYYNIDRVVKRCLCEGIINNFSLKSSEFMSHSERRPIVFCR